MAARLAALGGRLDVQSASDHGTTIAVPSTVAINRP
jgi:chemotaxis protein histidine kinase CheA